MPGSSFIDQSFITLLCVFSDIDLFRTGVLAQCPTPAMLEDLRFLSGFTPLVTVFVFPRDRVAQLYPQAPGTPFSRLVRHARVTVGLFFLPLTTHESIFVDCKIEIWQSFENVHLAFSLAAIIKEPQNLEI
jgi:hypothetical protein